MLWKTLFIFYDLTRRKHMNINLAFGLRAICHILVTEEWKLYLKDKLMIPQGMAFKGVVSAM